MPNTIVFRRALRWSEIVVREYKETPRLVAGTPENERKPTFRLTKTRKGTRFGGKVPSKAGLRTYKDKAKAIAEGMKWQDKEEAQIAFDSKRDAVYFRPKRRKRPTDG